MRAPADDIVELASRRLREGRRLDLSALAAELEISRPTLFRRVGNREELMGEALWRLASRVWRMTECRWEREHGARWLSPDGRMRSLGVLAGYGKRIVADQGFRRLLDEEPAVALRVLTDPFGRVQPRMIEAFAVLLRRDVADGGLAPLVDLDTLAYAVIRLCESIVYADVIADRAPDLVAATTMVEHLVEGTLQVRATARP
ncbi:QsdR family transcriptional regulator [Actinocorallia longicatena]|uniref:QsdR family transcriptional regulator n=1 Tax=Actinocorallia longicatena TaxID=111803 RepID=A0ABP6QKF9_9ACTN